MVGCGSSSNPVTPSGDGGNDSSSGSDAKADGGQDSSTPDTGTADTGVADTGTQETSMTAAATPSCSPAAGTFTTAQSVTLADTTAGATIFYTEDGTNPNPNSQVFSSPLAISTTTQVRAFATAPGFSDSAVQSCEYTINTQPGTCAAPTATPAAGVYNNDFPASLATTTGACGLICFTLDGSTPACNAGGTACVTPAQTYNAQNRIPINGTVTGTPATGEVVVTAVACAPNYAPGAMPAVQYTLKVAQPTVQGPSGDPTLHPYVNGGTISPTVGSATNAATGLYTANAGLTVTTAATCTSGLTLGTLPSNTIGLSDATGNQAVSAVACKAGYVDSDPQTAVYTVTLNAPAAGTTVPGTYDEVEPVTANDTPNTNATGEYTCWTTDGVTSPACGAGGTCATGQQQLSTNGAKIVFATNKRGSAVTGYQDLNDDGTIVESVACAPNFATSLQYTSAAYHEALQPIGFQCCAGGGTLAQCITSPGFSACTSGAVPNGGKIWVKGTETPDTGGTQETYDYICSSTDGVTTPDCTCDQTAHPSLTKTLATTFTSVGLTTATTVQMIGCVSPTSGATSIGNGALGDVFKPAAGSVSISAVGQVTAPNIEPTNPSIANPTLVTFQNTETVASGISTYFCYTTDNTVPTVAGGPSCWLQGSTHGSTICTTNTTAPGATSTDGVTVSTTGTWIQAIACDITGANKPSGPATPVQYQLVVGSPVITTKGAVDFGEAITITTATSGALISYSTNGTAPDCSGAFATIQAGTTKDANGLYDATYYTMGGETGALTVIGCKSGYTVSAATDNTTFTYSAAAPVALYADGATKVPAVVGATYDDYLNVTVEEPLNTGGGINGLWFCLGTTPGCSLVTAGQCTGTGSFGTAACSGITMTAGTANSAPQPTAAPECSNGGLGLPNASYSQVVACVPKVAATAGVTSSAGENLTYTYKVSQVELTTPVTMAIAGPVSFAGTPTVTPPDGDSTPILGATGNFAGVSDYLCTSSTQTIASLGPNQPSPCASFVGTPGWTCVSNGAANPTEPGDKGPTSTLADQGANAPGATSASYAAFECKDLMTWTTGTFPVTFTPYVHTPTFVSTGATSDFITGGACTAPCGNGENLAVSNAATAYVTFDQANLYVGFNSGVAYLGTGADIVHFYIGSSAGGTNGADNNSDVKGSINDGRTLPANFNALYHVYWKLDNSFTNTSSKWSGSAWVSDGEIASVKYDTGSTFVEFTVPLSALVGITASDIHLLGADYVGSPAADQGSWPSPNTNAGAWTAWTTELLNDAFEPNDTQLTGAPPALK
jgi:hypothetical protein